MPDPTIGSTVRLVRIKFRMMKPGKLGELQARKDTLATVLDINPYGTPTPGNPTVYLVRFNADCFEHTFDRQELEPVNG